MIHEVFIGYDPREDQMYKACVNSIVSNASRPVKIYPLVQAELRHKGYYFRDDSRDGCSTEFTFTRFLVPQLAKNPVALFVDCDFIFTSDINELFDLYDGKYDVMCVQHDYIPHQSIKMDGKVQKPFRRKNWSSLMLFNVRRCIFRLSPTVVSTETPAYLHQMEWATFIGGLPVEWNWLEGEYEKPERTPKAIHFTNGAPCFENYQDVDYKEEYWRYVIK